MDFSHVLHKQIVETHEGRVLNKLSWKRRRNVLYFEGLFAEFVKKGKKEEMRKLGEEWIKISSSGVWPNLVMKLPFKFKFSLFRKVWKSIGAIEDISFSRKGKKIRIEVLGEGIADLIGLNEFSFGVFGGMLEFLTGKKVKYVKKVKEGNYFVYDYLVTDEKIKIKTKSKSYYLKMNKLPVQKGFTLKDALKFHVFNIKKGKIYFRGDHLTPVEGTIFHLASYTSHCKELHNLAYNYFNKKLKESTEIEKLKLLKTLLQVMGWGLINFRVSEKEIAVSIKHLPPGFQLEEDNYEFLIQTISGFMMAVNKKFKFKKSKFSKQLMQLNLNFSKQAK